MNISRRINVGLLTANILLVMVVILLLVNNSSLAQAPQPGSVPRIVSYQGNLTDAHGNPVNSNVNLTIRLFGVETGGTALWTESYANWPVKKGVFSVLLGSQNPFPANLFTGPDCWLELTVNGEVLTPRQKFASVPYAVNAQMLGGLDAASYALASHTHAEVWNPNDGYLFPDYRNGKVTSLNGGFTYQTYGEDVPEFFNAFKDSTMPRSTVKKVKSIRALLVRTGAYDGGFTMAFEVRDFSGNLIHTVSASPFDLKTAPTMSWIDVPLSSTDSNLLIPLNTYLCIHVVRSGPAGGDLNVQALPLAEVE